MAKKNVPYDDSFGLRSDEDLKRVEKELGTAAHTLPLPQSFFLTSILGFLIASILTLSGRISLSWGFAFCLVFVMMFIASFVSITPIGEDV